MQGFVKLRKCQAQMHFKYGVLLKLQRRLVLSYVVIRGMRDSKVIFWNTSDAETFSIPLLGNEIL